MAKLMIEADPGWMGDRSRGAGMGRPDTLPENREADVKLYLRRMVMTGDGDYDQGGNYWGGWSPSAGGMYCAWGEYGDGTVRIFVRALNREAARAQVVAILSNARFYR